MICVELRHNYGQKNSFRFAELEEYRSYEYKKSIRHITCCHIDLNHCTGYGTGRCKSACYDKGPGWICIMLAGILYVGLTYLNISKMVNYLWQKFIRHSDLSDGNCCHDEVIDKRRIRNG